MSLGRTVRIAWLLAAVSAASCGRADGPAPGPTRFEGEFRGPQGDVLRLAETAEGVDVTLGGETVHGRRTSPTEAEGGGEVAGGTVGFLLRLGPEGVHARFGMVAEGSGLLSVPEVLYARVRAAASLPEDPAASARDARLAAHWRHTEARASGGFSYAKDTHLVLEADGRMSTWDKTRSSAGGSDSEVSQGAWKTEGNVLYLRSPADAPWQAAGRYTVTDTHLMRGSGSNKTVYERL